MLGALRQTNPAPAATGRCFDQQGIAHRLGGLERGLDVEQLIRRARHHGHASGLRGAAGLGFVTHTANGVGAGADKNCPGGEHGFGEVGVLGQEAITRMHRVGAGGFQRADQSLDVQVAFIGAGRAEDVDFIGHARGLGVDVGFAARGHGGNPQRLGGADNPHGDLATVGDQ